MKIEGHKKGATIRVLLADDHEVVRVGLKTVLEQDPQLAVIGEAATTAAAIAETARLQPDVVLLDLRISGGGGVQACAKILQSCPQVRVLFLTSFSDDEAILAALEAGAHGYVLKEIGSASLIETVKRVAGGESVLDAAITQRVMVLLKNKGAASSRSKLDLLSAQEQRIVGLIAEGMTNKEIAAALALSPKTIKNYLANVFQKLQISRRSQAAAFFVKKSTVDSE